MADHVHGLGARHGLEGRTGDMAVNKILISGIEILVGHFFQKVFKQAFNIEICQNKAVSCAGILGHCFSYALFLMPIEFLTDPVVLDG